MNDELKTQFADVKSLDGLLRLMAQQRELEIPEELWKRCALLDRFDSAVYTVLQQGLTAPSFTQLLERPEIDSIDGSASLKPDLRGPYLAKWTRAEPALEDIARRLAAAIQDPLESAALQAIADPQTAKAHFDRLYTEADQSFDLSRCNAILVAFRSRALLIDSGFLRDIRNEEQYYRSRVTYADYFWATLLYVQRPELLTPFQTFLGADDQWLLEIQGPGGLGKSMFLRWLISRHCVPKSEHGRVPVARLDMEVFTRSLEVNLASRSQPQTPPGQVETIWERFDFRTLAETPWLVLLLLAEQLRWQLPDSPLQTLLSSELLQLAQLLERKAVIQNEAYLRALAQDMQGKLEDLFAHGVGPNRVVIVFDTMEKLTINDEQLCRRLIQMFARLRQRCPGLHLLVSGRNPILAPLGLSGILLRIEPFTEEQRREYLVELCGLPQNEITRAIGEKSDGYPFHLANLANLAPTFHSVEDVLQSNPAMDYTLERVIDQIPDVEVRWIVRYAAVLGTFTKSAFAASLLPILQRELAADSPSDQTVIPPERSRKYANANLWPRSATPIDFDRAWASLTRYAAPQGWLQPRGEGFELLADVAWSLRNLLRHQPVYAHLQNAAAEWLADNGNLRESYMMRHEVDGASAYRYWPDLLRRARDQGPALVHSLATTTLTSDLAPAHRAVIAFEAAMSALLIVLASGTGDLDPPRIAPVVRYFDASRKDRPAPPRDQLERIQLVASAIAIAQKSPARVPLPLSLVKPEEQIGACLLQALNTEPDLRWRHYAQAATIARDHPQAYFNAEALDNQSARLVSNANPEEAWSVYESALTREISTGTPERIGELLVYMSDLAEVLGHWSKLRKHARGVASVIKFPAHEQAINVLVRSHLDRFDYQTARTWFARLNTKFNGIRAELAGDLSAAFFRFGEAEDHYRAAREDYERRGYHSSSMTVALKTARYLLDQYGNPERSLTFIDGLNQNRRFPEPSIGFDFFVLRLRQLAALRQLAQARQLYHELREYIDRTQGLTPLHALYGLATLLAEGAGDPTDVESFKQEFERHGYPLATLRPFLTAPPGLLAPQPLELNVKATIREDRTQTALYLAAAFRFFGSPARATGLLEPMAASNRPELLQQVRRLAPGLVSKPTHVADEPSFNATFDIECGLPATYSFPADSRWAQPSPASRLPDPKSPRAQVDVAALANQLPEYTEDSRRVIPYALAWRLQSGHLDVETRLKDVWPRDGQELTASNPYAGSIPWELAFPASVPLPYRHFARSTRIPAPPPGAPIVLLDPFAEYSPDSLTRFYKGLPFVSLRGGFEEIVGQLRSLYPRLIHIAAQFHDEERTNESGFQLSPDGPLTRAVDIAEILRATPDFAPIIILEPLWQPSDLGRQLLLRNHFAGTLAKILAPAAVIAIGPYASADEPPALLRELADPTTTPRRIYESLFAAAQRPYLPALFADDPDEPIWSPAA